MADAILGIGNVASRIPLAVDVHGAIVVGMLSIAAVLVRRRRMLRRDGPLVPSR
jgi:uncharacterized integral membrane protein